MAENILIFGTGGQAKVVVDTLEKQKNYEIAGFIEGSRSSGKQVEAAASFKYPLLGSDEDLVSLRIRVGIVAIGDAWIRAQVIDRIRALVPDFRFIQAIHPSAQIASQVSIGPGTVVMAGACINSGTRIGSHCIINTRASVDHDNQIGDFTNINPGVTLGGSVKVGNHSVLGIGASVVHGVEIGEHALIGAGSVVTRSIPACVVAYGVPCKVIRSRRAGESYL